MLKLCWLSLALSLGSFDLGLTQAVLRSSYGEPCNETLKCDKSLWLTCRESICGCMLEFMLWNSKQSKCISLVGERCKFQLSSESLGDNPGVGLYETSECVENAHCSNGLSCQCNIGFFETLDGACEKKRLVESKCESSAECDDSKDLFCIEGKCSCATHLHHIYDATKQRCAGMAGMFILDTDCLTGTELQNGICTCIIPAKYYNGSDGRCHLRKDVDEHCTNDEECIRENRYLKCVNGICGCDSSSSFRKFTKTINAPETREVKVWKLKYRNPDRLSIYTWANPEYPYGTKYYLYDGYYTLVFGNLSQSTNYYSETEYVNAYFPTTEEVSRSECVGLARHKCNLDSSCVANANCAVANRCSCDADYAPTASGMCGLTYGMSCNTGLICSDSFRCTNSKCNCPFDEQQYYDESLSKCIGLVSTYCSSNSDCTTNAQCIEGYDTYRKQCTCEPGYIENKDLKCEKAHGSKCDYSDLEVCDSVAQLKCRNGICNCASEMSFYSSSNRICQGLVGSKCSKDTPVTDACVGNASCIQVHPRFTGRCYCDAGYEVTEAMFCGRIIPPPTSTTQRATTQVSKDSAQNLLSAFANTTAQKICWLVLTHLANRNPG